jgi:hypothetical protein
MMVRQRSLLYAGAALVVLLSIAMCVDAKGGGGGGGGGGGSSGGGSSSMGGSRSSGNGSGDECKGPMCFAMLGVGASAVVAILGWSVWGAAPLPRTLALPPPPNNTPKEKSRKINPRKEFLADFHFAESLRVEGSECAPTWRYKWRRPSAMYSAAVSKLTNPGNPGALGQPPSCQWTGGYLEGGGANGEEQLLAIFCAHVFVIRSFT